MMGLNVYDNAKYQYFEGLSTPAVILITARFTSTGALAKEFNCWEAMPRLPIIGYDDTKQAFLWYKIRRELPGD